MSTEVQSLARTAADSFENIAHTIHTLEVIALLVPFVAISLGLIVGVFAIAWMQPKGRR